MNARLNEANRRYDETLYNYMRVDASEENARELKKASKTLNDTIGAIESEKAEGKIAKTMTDGELYRYAWVAVREAIENINKWEKPSKADIERLQSQEKELKELMEMSFTKTA